MTCVRLVIKVQFLLEKRQKFTQEVVYCLHPEEQGKDKVFQRAVQLVGENGLHPKQR